jgi:GNAT superfamily N-acetyltransferase
VETARLADGRVVTIRTVREEDDAAERRFFAQLSPRTRRLRFHGSDGVPDDSLIRFYTRVDQQHHLAFACEHAGEIVGEARCIANPDGTSCELGIVVADDWHHTGVAQLLMEALLAAARAGGYRSVEGLVLSDNAGMLDFVKTFGFEVQLMPLLPSMLRVVKPL